MTIWKGVLLVIFAVLLSGCQNGLPAAQWGLRNGDLAVLARTLESAHPDLFFHESRSEFQNSVLRAQDKLRSGQAPRDAFLAISGVLTALGDSHTGVDPYTRDYLEFRDHKGLLFPLELRFEGAKAVVIANFERTKAIPEGSTVESIAELSIPHFLERLGPLSRGETPALKAWLISNDLRALMWIGGFRAPFPIVYRTPGGMRLRTTMRGATIDAVHAWDRSPGGVARLTEYSIRVDRARAVALLTVHTFDTKNARDWHGFVQGMRGRLKAERVTTLIVDVRENSGGSTVLSDELLRIVAKRPFRDFSETKTKVSAEIKKALGRDRYIERFGQDAWNAPDGSVLSGRGRLVEPLPAGEGFGGRVYIIVGSGTYSTAAIFAAAAQDSGNATIVGQDSGGFPTLFGETYSFTLPKSELEVSVSTKHFVRANGDRSARGVIPDQAFVETPAGPNDAELDAIERFALKHP